MTTFDDILEEVGKFGRCQKRVFALLCLVSMPWAGVYVGIVFQGFTPEHWCKDPAARELRESCGWGLHDARRHTVPLVNSSVGMVQSQCQQYDVDWNDTSVTCEEPRANFTAMPLTACKDGWEYDYEGRVSFVTEFDLVCANAWMVDMYQATLNVGFLVGSIAIGYLADRFGRKMSFLMSNLLNAIAGMVVAVSPNYNALLVFRMFYGFGVKGGWVAGYVLITELVGVEYRRTVGVVYQMFFSVGILIMPLIAYFISDWRWFQVAITVPYIFFLGYYWFIPESPRWLLSQNNSSKAVEITKAIAKENGKTLSKNLETLKDDTAVTSTASILDLFKTPKMRKHTFILMFNWFTSAVVYQGLIMRLGILGGMFWFKTAVACVGRLGITMTFEMVVFVNTELYPTFVRNLGVSVCSTLCDVGGIVAPFLLYRLAVIWLELPLIIFGVLAFIAGGLVLMLPETRGVPLPETIDDIEFPNRNKERPLKNQQLVNLLPSDMTTNKDPIKV